MSYIFPFHLNLLLPLQGRGTLLDASSVKTLENPEEHSVHCLVDVSVCKKSPFHVLESNPPDLDTAYGPGWTVDDNRLLVENARQVGNCDTCTGDGSLRDGYRAEVIGNVLSLDPPLLEVVQVRKIGPTSPGCTQPMDPNNTIPPAPAPVDSAADSGLPTIVPALFVVAVGSFLGA